MREQRGKLGAGARHLRATLDRLMASISVRINETTMLVEAWIAHLQNGAERPYRDIWREMRPGGAGEGDVCPEMNAIFDALGDRHFDELRRAGIEELGLLKTLQDDAQTLFKTYDGLVNAAGISRLFTKLERIIAFATRNFGNLEMSAAGFRQELEHLWYEEMEAQGEFAGHLQERFGQAAARAETLGGEAREIVAEVGGAVTRACDANGREVCRTVKTTINRAMTNPEEGCHHPDAKKDMVVQQVIKLVARRGASYTLHRACTEVAGKTKRGTCLETWLYSWLHDNQASVEEAIARARELGAMVEG